MNKIKKFLNYIYKINYSFYILIFNFIIIGSTILFLFFIYNSDTIMFKAVDIFDERTQNALNVKDKRNSIMKFVENINLFSSKLFQPIEQINYDKLPVFDLELSRKNINYINDVISRALDQSNNIHSLGPFISIYDNDFIDDTKSKLFYNGEEYNVKVKLHGVADDNWINPKKSYSIKTSKEKFFKNIRRFKLIILEEQSIQTLFSYYLSKVMGYFNVSTEIVRLRINGIDQGLYLFEETLSKETLERNELPGVDVIKALDEWTHQYNTGHLTPFTHEVANQNFDNISGKDLGQILLFKELISASSYRELEHLIDIDKFALFEAMRIIFATDHAIAGDNLKLLFDTTSGKFFPFFRMEGYLLPLQESNHSYTFDKELNDWFGYDYKIKIFPILNRDNNFRFLRNKYLHKILSQRVNLENYYYKLYEDIKPLIKFDKTNNKPARWYLNKMESSIKNLNQNFEFIYKYLNYSRVYTSINIINEKELILEITPDSNSALGLENIDFGFLNGNTKVKIIDLNDKLNNEYSEITSFQKYFSQKFFSLDLDESLEIKKSTYKFKIKFLNNNLFNDFNKKNFKITYRNLVSDNLVSEKENYYIITRTPSKSQSNLVKKNIKISQLTTKYPNIKVASNKLVFKKGYYEIDEHIVLPFDVDIKIESGAHLEIHPNISIIGRANLEIEGTKQDPVIIKNKKLDKPFGVFGIVGNGKTNVDITRLNLSGGSEDSIFGVYLSGALSLYHHENVHISSSVIQDNKADDGLNIKNANVNINNNVLKFNFADAIDCDFCHGFFSNNKFVNGKGIENNNGDGLDLSGSKIFVHSNTFENFKDKAMSVGENTSAIISSNVFNDNRSAITLKDSSQGYIFSNIYKNNEINLEMYQKKLLFEYPVAYIYNKNIIDQSIIKEPQAKIFKSQNIVDESFLIDVNDLSLIFKSLSIIKWSENE